MKAVFRRSRLACVCVYVPSVYRSERKLLSCPRTQVCSARRLTRYITIITKLVFVFVNERCLNRSPQSVVENDGPEKDGYLRFAARVYSSNISYSAS